MHTFGEGSSGPVPAFLAKLWRLVDDKSTDDLILWSADGRTFIIQNQARFAKELLPLNYKHNNMASFIRQLNMYGFHKITSIDNGGLRFDRDEMEFSHPCFQKGHPYLLEHIKRKITHPKQQEDKNVVKIEAVNRMLNEVKNMRGRQDALDSRFSSMKQENEALWREVAILRQKHLKQQQIVNKLIQFLVTMVQPSRSGLGGVSSGLKRRFQLMINDAPRSSKDDRSDSPIIHELEEELLDDIADEDSKITQVANVVSPGGQDEDSLQSGSDPSNGRQSVDYVVDHFDDFEPCESIEPAKGMSEDTLSTPGYDRIQKQVTAQLVETKSRKRGHEGGDHIQEKQQRLTMSGGEAEAKTVKNKARNGIGAQEGKSLLKMDANKKTTNQQYTSPGKFLKSEVNPFHSVPVPDVLTTQNTLSPGSSMESGKSFYCKDDLFTDEVPGQLFDDEECLLDAASSPLLSAGVDLNMEGYGNTSEPTNTSLISQNNAKASTSISPKRDAITLSDGTQMQVTKFNGKSNTNDISRLHTTSDLNSHLNDVQDDLETLKDILKAESYQFDANALLNLFNEEELLPYEVSGIQNQLMADNNTAVATNDSASALAEYQPVDLSELLVEIAAPSDYDETPINGSTNTAP